MLFSLGIQLIPVRLFHACCLPLSGWPAVLSLSKQKEAFVGLSPLFYLDKRTSQSSPTLVSICATWQVLRVGANGLVHSLVLCLPHPVVVPWSQDPVPSPNELFAAFVHAATITNLPFLFTGMTALHLSASARTTPFTATAALRWATPPRPFAFSLKSCASRLEILFWMLAPGRGTTQMPFPLEKRQEKNISRRRLNAVFFVLLFLLCFGTAEWQRLAYDNIIIQTFCLYFKDLRFCSPSLSCFAMAFSPLGCFRLGQHVLQLSLRICTVGEIF